MEGEHVSQVIMDYVSDSVTRIRRKTEDSYLSRKLLLEIMEGNPFYVFYNAPNSQFEVMSFPKETLLMGFWINKELGCYPIQRKQIKRICDLFPTPTYWIDYLNELSPQNSTQINARLKTSRAEIFLMKLHKWNEPLYNEFVNSVMEAFYDDIQDKIIQMLLYNFTRYTKD